jgi:preprotein translocase subunit SecA
MISEFLIKSYEDKKSKTDPEIFKTAEKEIYLQTIDMLWMEHLSNMQRLREQTSLA